MALIKGVLSKVRSGLRRTRQALAAPLRSVLSGRTLDEALIREIEAALIQADVGVAATRRLVGSIREARSSGALTRGEDALEHLKAELKAMWPSADRALRLADTPPTVILVAGINGSGKTTTTAKLAAMLQAQGKSVLLGACDTFRAGAVKQLEVWAHRLTERAGAGAPAVHLVRGAEGGDPAAVAFDACDAAVSRGVDVVILDTAGRLHTQDPLMRQLAKIRDVAAKRIPGAPHEVLLVLDATSGQNALRQAAVFTDAIDVTGIILAKLDGTARGGSVVAIRQATDIPVKFIGVGETPEDLAPFDPDAFVEALFATDDADRAA
ncbi:MAG: signal recognition particle-docking protein FtsY [Planctomycetota bacterium]|nr:MAG: signal recognition particle-docking protein FtsY [Planctomycetota bacterium]